LKAVALIMLEGFSNSYISKKNTPFLQSIATEGNLSLLEPLFAFRGIEATIFTGLYPNQHDVWTEFCLRDGMYDGPRGSTISTIENAFKDSLFLCPNDKMKKLFRHFCQSLKKENVQMSHLIPARSLRFFNSTLNGEIFKENVLGDIPTFFDMLRMRDQSFVYVEFSSVPGRSILSRLEKAMRQSPETSFYYIKLCEHDAVGHKYGPTSGKMEDCLIRLDKELEKIVSFLRRHDNDLVLVILSAHGMCNVKGTVNIKKQLKLSKARLYSDYLLFLDSTMARFWFLNSAAEKEIRNVLNELNHGHILADSEIKQLKIPTGKKHGELIFVVDEGYVIHPSYFHVSQIPNGMHGFAYHVSMDNYAPLITFNTDVSNDRKLVQYADVYNMLLTEVT
jgi:predicted AlkP superfamily pyrophosphatase or phosphodiesterase